ncbi:hypothetical protein BC938DRAFT_482789 [Jimgerdemannia flammicorona]|uniref:GDP/GTP exchange factor Sec2 N-terminal domain-containing protein n=1 Tax=Jimgerdemannia flammicorona TaxID=994334 RepID=A0A433QW35_9FUNG|nr:hypothetical protein BC938DRAFT_482789 [Jimgerdemannia flammicorona]
MELISKPIDAISLAPSSILGDMGLGNNFNEEDVLPFLLQAQDVIAKFESRVVELEKDLSTISRAYEHDRNEWLTGLSQKDFYIHHLSKKLQRLEFSNKEAIVVLSDIQPRPNMFSEARSTVFDEYETKIAGKINLALDYLKNAQNTAPPNDDIAVIDHEDEEYEEGELERRQAATNTWRRRESVISVADSMLSHKIMMGLVKQRAESIHFRDDVTDLDFDLDDTELDVDDLGYRESIDESSSSRQTDVDSLRIDTRTALSTITAASSASPIEDENHHHHHHHHHHDDDYFTTHTQPAPSSVANGSPAMVMKPPGTAFCPNCRQLLSQLDQQIEQKAYLKRDMSSLAANLAEEQELRVNIEHAKELLETDVDELVSAMFDLVNRTIMDEAEASASGVAGNRDVREGRLHDMKTILVELDSAKRRATNVSSLNVQSGNGSNASIRNGSVTAGSIFSFGASKRLSFGGIAGIPATPQRLSSCSSVRTSISGGGSSHPEDFWGTPQRHVYVDGLGFAEFQEHIKTVLGHSSTVTAYMKRVLVEDVEPTLFQTGTQTWWKSPWFKRKLIDAIARNCCEIQTYRTSTSTPSPSSSRPATPTTPTVPTSPVPAPKTKCASCGSLRLCEYRMRITSPDPRNPTADPLTLAGAAAGRAPWLPIDRFCRDRLVAVCDFYTFLSHLRQGLLSHSPVLALYKQSLYYRRKMGLSRVGSMGLFGEDADKGWDHTGGQQQVGPKRGSLVMTNGANSGTGESAPASLVNVGVGGNGWETSGTIVIVH